ncbi:MAG: lipoate--protein ligase [Eubacteriales bacterium]|nr:lipoate--protein ligase [Eubacteriales bacterium]
MITKLRLCSSTSYDPYRNLALEERFFNTVKPGECILYLWQNQRTVVIGRNQNARAQCRVDALEKDGGHLARRLSGGGAVFHDLGNLNFTFLVRDKDYDVRRQLSVICAAVKRFGIQAEVSGRNDVLTEGRKFSGNAFHRSGDRRYHHGTLLVDVNTEQMMKYLSPDVSKLQAKGVDSVRARVVNLKTLCPAMTIDRLRAAMSQAFGQVYGSVPEKLLEPEEEALREGKERFASYEWLYGQERDFTLQTETLRFPWGGAQLCLAVDHGKVKDAALYTDAMEPELATYVQKATIGVTCREEPLSRALSAAAKQNPAIERELLDLRELLKGL